MDFETTSGGLKVIGPAGWTGRVRDVGAVMAIEIADVGSAARCVGSVRGVKPCRQCHLRLQHGVRRPGAGSRDLRKWREIVLTLTQKMLLSRSAGTE